MDIRKLDERTQKMLEDILIKEPRELSTEEVEILRARTSYLSGYELEKFHDLLEVQPKIKPLEKMNRDELYEVATSLGLDIEKLSDLKNKEIVALIQETQPIQ